MKKNYLLFFILLSWQSIFAQNYTLEAYWENTNNPSKTKLTKSFCGPGKVTLHYSWDPGFSIQKAIGTPFTTDEDKVYLIVEYYQTANNQWLPYNNSGALPFHSSILGVDNSDPGTTGSMDITVNSTGVQKFRVTIKKEYIDSNGVSSFPFTKSTPEYELHSTITPLTLSSELKAGSQTFQSSSTFSTSNIVCDDDLILEKIKWNQCAKQYVLYLDEVNPSTGQTTPVKTIGPAPISGLSASMNLNTVFGNDLQKGKLYRINLKVGNGNGVWTSLNHNVFYINYHSTKNPSISINTPNDICIGTPVTITLADPPNNFQWTSTSGSLPTGISSTITPTQTGVYNITTNDHCVNLPNDLQITVKALPTVDASNNQSVHCTNVLNPIQLSANATPSGGTGTWSINQGTINAATGVFDPNQNSIPNNFIATYNYTAPNGCSNSDDFSFAYYDPSTFTTTVNNLTCHNSNDGAIFTLATGTPPYNFSLNGQSGFSSLTAGTYQVELTDGHGCISTQSVAVTQPQAITAALNLPSPYAVSCYGAGIYVQVINVQGGTGTYLYNFGTGFTSNSGKLLYPKSTPYQIQVKDQNGCIKNLSFQLNAPAAPITAVANSNHPTCYGIANGNIALTISGGTAPYSVSWNNGSTGATNNNLAAGVHTYTITDANGCKLSNSITLTNGSSGITVSETITNSSCHGTNDGAIALTYNPNYSYAWSTGDVGNSISNLVDNNYNVTLTNNASGSFYGCKTIKHYAVNTNNQSYWHKNTLNTTGGEDKIIKTITDANNNVYALGAFTGATEIDGQAIQAGSSNQKGIFVSKHDACGKLKWLAHSTISTNLDIFGLEIILDGANHLQVFGELDNTATTSFNMENTDGNTQTLTLNASNDVFSVRIDLLSGAFSNANDYAIDYADDVNGIAMDNNLIYFAGKFNNKAEVWRYNGGALNPLFGDSNPDNEMTAIAVDGSNIYVTANLIAPASFNGNFIPVNGLQEAVLLHYNNGTLVTQAAQAENMSLNDVLIADNGQVWVAGQWAGPTSWGNGLHAKYPTAIVASFAPNAITNNTNTFYIDHKNSMFTQATAIALSEKNDRLYTTGTYRGQIIGMKQAQSNNLVQEAGGMGNHPAMWLASIDLSSSTPSLDWINLSMSNSPIEVFDIATDGFNSYVVGAYQEDMVLPPSSNLFHPSNGQQLGYIIRGGAAYGQAVFYRTVAGNGNGTASTAIAHLSKEVSSNTTSFMTSTESIHQTASPSSIQLFPNPNKGNFTVQLEGIEKGSATVKIMDISNRIVYQQQTEMISPKITVALAPLSLQKGMYILNVEINGQQHYAKFLLH
ncbi:T9SS type A sorting domain-containing protein [Aureispira anguillae]|nr:T9SS type A sorting domain-containing protein [Aureispira anguillae]